MAFRDRTKAGRVRVTRRVTRKIKPYGAEVIGRPGELITLGEAERRGLKEADYEVVGAQRAKAVAEPAAKTSAKKTSAKKTSGKTSGTKPSETPEFPRDRGGGNWELSDGSTVKGKKVEAEQAEEQLQAAAAAAAEAAAEAAAAGAKGEGEGGDDADGAGDKGEGNGGS